MINLTREQEIEVISSLAIAAGLSDNAIGRIVRELFAPKSSLDAAARESGQETQAEDRREDRAPHADQNIKASGAAAEPADCRLAAWATPPAQRREVRLWLCKKCAKVLSFGTPAAVKFFVCGEGGLCDPEGVVMEARLA